MATKKLVHDIVTSFSTLTPRKMEPEATQALEQAYYLAFQHYSDKQIKEAGQKYLEDGDFYPPRPTDILKRVKNISNEKHERELIEMWTCNRCHQKVSCISPGGICADCQGYPVPTYKHIKPWFSEKPILYKIEGRMKCQQCGKVTECIKQPIDDGQFLCKDCYSGLTAKERSKRFDDLAKMISDKEYPFSQQRCCCPVPVSQTGRLH